MISGVLLQVASILSYYRLKQLLSPLSPIIRMYAVGTREQQTPLYLRYAARSLKPMGLCLPVNANRFRVVEINGERAA